MWLLFFVRVHDVMLMTVQDGFGLVFPGCTAG